MKTGRLNKGNSTESTAYLEPANEESAGLLSADDFKSFICSISTGVMYGGILSIEPGNNTFAISAGSGTITSIQQDVTERWLVNWDNITGITSPFLTTDTASWVFINHYNHPEFVPISVTVPASEFKRKIFLGRIVHSNHINYTSVISEIMPCANPIGQLRDFLSSYGAINISGNEYGPAGGLGINKTPGISFRVGSNYQYDNLNPHIINNNAISLADFKYRWRTTNPTVFISGTQTNSINPNQYDNGSGSLQPVPANYWTIQEIYLNPAINVPFAYFSQRIFASRDLAVANLNLRDKFQDSLSYDTLLRTLLVVKQGATNLNDASQALFFTVNKNGVSSYNPNFIINPVTANISSGYVHNQITPSLIWNIPHF